MVQRCPTSTDDDFCFGDGFFVYLILNSVSRSNAADGAESDGDAEGVDCDGGGEARKMMIAWKVIVTRKVTVARKMMIKDQPTI